MKLIIRLLPVFLFFNTVGFSQPAYTTHPAPAGLVTTQARMNDLVADANNLKWVAFGNYGLGSYDGTNWTMYNTSNSALPSDSVISITFDQAGNMWAGTKEGAVLKAGSNWTVFNSSNSGLPTDIITEIYTNNMDVWFGTYSGLVKYDGTNWTVYNTSNSGLPNDSVTVITIDNQGSVWAGTRNGLAKFDSGSWMVYNTSNSNLKSFIYDLETDAQNRLWISSGILTFQPGYVSLCTVDYFENGTLYNFIEENYFYDVPITYYQGTQFSKDNSGNIAFQVGTDFTFNRILFYYLNGHLTYFILPTLNLGIWQYGTLLEFDNSNDLWWIPRLRFNFYSLIPDPNANFSLDGLNFNNHRTLNINSVNAAINVPGDMHWDLYNPKYEVPKGQGKNSVYSSAFWIGGLDNGGQLHMSAQTYRQTGMDYWPGPVSGIAVPFDSTVSHDFNRIWKIDKWKIEEFKQQYSLGNVTTGVYPIPEEFLTWPANGNGIVNTDKAPFTDFNNDGQYNPLDGDYPLIKGDQMLFHIFNDSLGAHNVTNSQKLGVEVHVSSYAYSCPGIADSNSVLNTTTLYKYKIINQSNFDYSDIYIGLWCDNDLGNSIDDYIGCDTTLAAGFVYNGDNDDEGAYGYGLNPPMQNIKILKGMLADPGDGIDNDLDGIIDEPDERTTMNHFLTYYGGNGSPASNPVSANDYYYYLQSIWLNGQHLTYGGDGLDPNSYPTNFFFSGTPYDLSGWTEASSGNTPEDRRFLMSSGPVSLAAGDTIEIDFAYIFTRDSLNPNGLTTSIARNIADLQRVQHWFDIDSFPSCEVYTTSLNEIHKPEFVVFPNPSSNRIFISMNGRQTSGVEYKIYNILGGEVDQGLIDDNGIDISKLTPQTYIISILVGDEIRTSRFVKLPR